MSKVEDYQQLKRDVERLKASQIKAGADKSATQSAFTDKLQKVKQEFGVSTIEGLASLAASIDKEVETEFSNIRAILEQVKNGV